MAIRWRADGELVCAAAHAERQDDTYIDDRLHYWLSVVCRALVADVAHEENGLWHWTLGNGPFLRGVLEAPAEAQREAPCE